MRILRERGWKEELQKWKESIHLMQQGAPLAVR